MSAVKRPEGVKKVIGARLRALREEPRDELGHSRWSREKWAIKLRGAAGPSAQAMPGVQSLAQMIKQWECGDHVPGPFYRALYASVTGKTEKELFKEALSPEPPTSLTKLVGESPLTSLEDDVRRRAAMQVIAALGAGAAIPPGLLETALSGIEDALGNPQDTAEWERLVADYDHRLNASPAGALAGELTTDLAALSVVLKRNLPPLQTATLLRVSAALSGLLAIDFSDAGDYRASRVAWGAATRAADGSGDQDMQVWTRGQQAKFSQYSGGSPSTLVALADEAHRIAGGTASPGLAHAIGARMYLAIDDGDAEKVRALLAEMNRVCERIGDTEPGHSVFRFRETQRLWSESYAYAQAGDKRAAESLAQARGLYPMNVLAPRVNLTLIESVSLVKGREVGEGLELALNVLQGQERTSAGGRMLTGSVLGLLPPEARSLPEAREIRALTAGPV
ncbi:XRE family transcriptional regulator [Actinomadura terrae]|uniref:XRE family transcriptional regulator n=1 Tax=Actinomadura terrae TaxID=604353 RepID=UPI001FA7CD57|nr:XRE family transcriptional regulator [Actinomadura terrae]